MQSDQSLCDPNSREGTVHGRLNAHELNSQTTHSSDFATGTVLSQLFAEDDKWHPVAYFSKSLSETERNYKIHDKEMLAIIRALEEWRHFLEGAPHKFEIWTDHKNLEYFMSAKKLNRRQARWSLTLARFDFLMHHRPGKTMGKSDALSRRADHGNVGNCTGNPGVFQRNPYPYPWKPVPVCTGMGFVWVRVRVLYLNMYILI